MINTALTILETDEQRNELSVFYDKYKDKFYAIAYSNLHNRELAEDAVQDTFMKIAMKPEMFFTKSEKDRLSYTAIIVRNTSVDIFKKNNKNYSDELTDDTADPGLSVEEQVVGEISQDEILKLIESMSEANRQVILFRVHFQMSNSEIAETLNISETAVRKRISNVMKIIREYMEEKCNE